MPLVSTQDSASDARWAAWLARGVAHDRVVRRRFLTLGPTALAIAVVVYLWFGR